jgi:uncharacterized protein
MKEKGHKILIFCRERDVVKKLMLNYNLEYISKGYTKNDLFNKLKYMIISDIKIYQECKKFKPDIFLSFSSPYSAQIACIMKKPHIAFNDTEHSDKIHKKFTYPFTDTICTPNCYYNSLGSKQIKFNAFMETSYLHEKYFKKDSRIYKYLGIKKNVKYYLIRFVSWNALHDKGYHGLNIETKREIIELLIKKAKVYISSEYKLENEFKDYQLNIPPELIHSVIASAELFISESATMASESAILGTPVVYINSLPLMGYLIE